MVAEAFGKQPQALDIAKFEIVVSFGQCESDALKKLARKLYESLCAFITRGISS